MSFNRSVILLLSFDLIFLIHRHRESPYPQQLVLELWFEMEDEGKIRVERFNDINFGF